MKLTAQKLFNKYGVELRNVFDLEYDSELWLSFGEPFKNPFSKLCARSIYTLNSPRVIRAHWCEGVAVCSGSKSNVGKWTFCDWSCSTWRTGMVLF